MDAEVTTSVSPLDTVTVDLADRSYDILVGHGALDQLGARLSPMLKQPRVFVLTDETVERIHRHRLDEALASTGVTTLWKSLLPGEKTKSFSNLEGILDWLLEASADRGDVLIALGGGVIGDITGLAASLMKRGMKFVQVPTTLLAQVDSSVGGKTAVNTPRGKNMIGAFYQPECVLIDTDVLGSLPEREIKAGLAEVLKYGLIIDAGFFDWLDAHAQAVSVLDPQTITQAIRKCCEIKADVVARDEREGGLRALLNLGHTFGHAIETAAGYGTWLHGETVAMGMVMAADLSRRLGWIDGDSAHRVRAVLAEKYGMPVIPPADISVERYLELMASDKKVEQGTIRFVLLRAIGDAVVEGGIDSQLLKQTLTAGEELCR